MDAIPELSESNYYALWMQHIASRYSPFEKAYFAGLWADQPAWVFVAGYQGALAHTFPEQNFPGWGALAISEDKNPEAPLPGLTGVPAGVSGCYELSGYKTWVATSRHVRDLVVSFGVPDEVKFARVAADVQGLELTHKDAPRMLPDLSQGVANFRNVNIGAQDIVHSDRVSHFGAIEAFFVLVALLGTWRRFSGLAGLDDSSLDELLDLAYSFADTPQACAPFKAACRDTLRTTRDHMLGQHALWQRDGQLLAGYCR